MQSTLYEAEHTAFRHMTRAFLVKHVVPFHDQWESDGMVDRGIWTAGRQAGPARDRRRRGLWRWRRA
ncbi:MAG: acyl-CoA dehydrogenase family protein [Geodermatophilaceae bacterium]